MRNEKSKREVNLSDVNGSDDRETFEEALASLRPRADRLDPAWRSLLSKTVGVNAALLSERLAMPIGKSSSCDHPAGHQFICVHCGSDAPGASGTARWVWPSALAAMTSIAAVLLMMLVANRQVQVADQTSRSGTKGSIAAVAPEFRPVAETPGPANRDRTGSAADRLAAMRREAGILGDRGVWPPNFGSKQRDGRVILSAGDMERDVKLSLFSGFFSSN